MSHQTAQPGPTEIPASPPRDVLEEIAAAAAAWEELKSCRREVRFGTDRATGKLSVALWDTDGNFLRSLSARQVLDLASGAPLDFA